MLFPQPAIEILGIQVNEPVTTLTDLMVSAVCFYAFVKISKAKSTKKIKSYLRFYFLSMSIATFIGGIIGHGFLYMFDSSWDLPEGLTSFVISIVGENNMNATANPWKLPGWLTSMFSIALVERAAIAYASRIIKPAIGRFFAWLNIIELTTFVILTFSTLNFFFVEIHSFYGLMIVVAGFSLYTFIKTRSKGSKLFLVAVGFSAISALFFMNQWSFHTWFNYLDISHTFMTVGAFFFYKGSMAILKECG